MFRIALHSVAKAAFSPILRQQLRERLETATTFNKRGDVNLAAEEVADLAFVVVQGRDHEEVHEGRSVTAIIEDCLADLGAASESVDHALDGRIRRLGALEEATVAADSVLAAILGGVVEFCGLWSACF